MLWSNITDTINAITLPKILRPIYNQMLKHMFVWFIRYLSAIEKKKEELWLTHRVKKKNDSVVEITATRKKTYLHYFDALWLFDERC